jgi:chloramphenicol 3-O phosphotransferase
MKPRIVFLNGTPSSGKSTLARAIHPRLEAPTYYRSLDDFLLGIQDRFWSDAGVPGLFADMREAWLAGLREIALRGYPVLSESVIFPADLAHYDDLFGDFDVVMIGVRSPLAVATERETRRSDRRTSRVDLDVPGFDDVHRHDYPLQVDTSVEPTEQSVDRILEFLTSREAT